MGKPRFRIYSEVQMGWRREFRKALREVLLQSNDVGYIKQEAKKYLNRQNRQAREFLTSLNIHSILEQIGADSDPARFLFFLYSYLGLHEKLKELINSNKGQLSSLYGAEVGGGRNAAFFAGQEGNVECLKVLYKNYPAEESVLPDSVLYFSKKDDDSRTGLTQAVRNGDPGAGAWYFDTFPQVNFAEKANHDANALIFAVYSNDKGTVEVVLNGLSSGDDEEKEQKFIDMLLNVDEGTHSLFSRIAVDNKLEMARFLLENIVKLPAFQKNIDLFKVVFQSLRAAYPCQKLSKEMIFVLDAFQERIGERISKSIEGAGSVNLGASFRDAGLPSSVPKYFVKDCQRFVDEASRRGDGKKEFDERESIRIFLQPIPLARVNEFIIAVDEEDRKTGKTEEKEFSFGRRVYLEAREFCQSISARSGGAAQPAAESDEPVQSDGSVGLDQYVEQIPPHEIYVPQCSCPELLKRIDEKVHRWMALDETDVKDLKHYFFRFRETMGKDGVCRDHCFYDGNSGEFGFSDIGKNIFFDILRRVERAEKQRTEAKKARRKSHKAKQIQEEGAPRRKSSTGDISVALGKQEEGASPSPSSRDARQSDDSSDLKDTAGKPTAKELKRQERIAGTMAAKEQRQESTGEKIEQPHKSIAKKIFWGGMAVAVIIFAFVGVPLVFMLPRDRAEEGACDLRLASRGQVYSPETTHIVVGGVAAENPPPACGRGLFLPIDGSTRSVPIETHREGCLNVIRTVFNRFFGGSSFVVQFPGYEDIPVGLIAPARGGAKPVDSIASDACARAILKQAAEEARRRVEGGKQEFSAPDDRAVRAEEPMPNTSNNP